MKKLIMIVAVLAASEMFGQLNPEDVQNGPASPESTKRLGLGKERKGLSELEKIEKDNDEKYPALKIEGLAGFKFGEEDKGFEYRGNAGTRLGRLYTTVKLNKPIRHFTYADLHYSITSKKLSFIRLVADARGVSKEQMEMEVDAVRKIIEDKFKIKMLGAGFGYYSFCSSKYHIVLDGRPVALSIMRPHGPHDLLKLEINDRTVDKSLSADWKLGPEDDADKF